MHETVRAFTDVTIPVKGKGSHENFCNLLCPRKPGCQTRFSVCQSPGPLISPALYSEFDIREWSFITGRGGVDEKFPLTWTFDLSCTFRLNSLGKNKGMVFP